MSSGRVCLTSTIVPLRIPSISRTTFVCHVLPIFLVWMFTFSFGRCNFLETIVDSLVSLSRLEKTRIGFHYYYYYPHSVPGRASQRPAVMTHCLQFPVLTTLAFASFFDLAAFDISQTSPFIVRKGIVWSVRSGIDALWPWPLPRPAKKDHQGNSAHVVLGGFTI